MNADKNSNDSFPNFFESAPSMPLSPEEQAASIKVINTINTWLGMIDEHTRAHDGTVVMDVVDVSPPSSESPSELTILSTTEMHMDVQGDGTRSFYGQVEGAGVHDMLRITSDITAQASDFDSGRRERVLMEFVRATDLSGLATELGLSVEQAANLVSGVRVMGDGRTLVSDDGEHYTRATSTSGVNDVIWGVLSSLRPTLPPQ